MEITPEDVVRKRENKEPFILLDCRTTEEHALAHIAGDRLIPLPELPARIDELREHDSGEEQSIIVYCHTGRRSLMAAHLLRETGFSNAQSMAGGIQRWSEEIDPTVPTY